MSSTYWVRYNADTTEVEADNYDEARNKASEEFDVGPHHLDDIEEVREGEFNELFSDVHVTLDEDSDWTCALTVETNEDSEYQREVLYELEHCDEVGLFGAYFTGDGFHGTFEKSDVTILIRGGEHDGVQGGSVYVVDNASDLTA